MSGSPVEGTIRDEGIPADEAVEGGGDANGSGVQHALQVEINTTSEDQMLSPREGGDLSPNTRKLIENLAEGSVIGDSQDGADAGSGAQSGPPSDGQHSTASVDAAAATRAAVPPPQGNVPGVGTGPMHMLYTGGQMLPVGHALQFLGAQQQMQLQNLPAAQQMLMFYLQGQHANYLHQAAMGTPPQPVQQRLATAAGGNGAESSAPPSAPPAQESAPQLSLLEQQQKVLQAQAQLQQQQVDTVQSLYFPV